MIENRLEMRKINTQICIRFTLILDQFLPFYWLDFSLILSAILSSFQRRRDSFITHRAFCDALAEETARFTAASHMNHNNQNLNYHLIGSSLGLGQQHFPPIFKSNSIDTHSNIPKNLPLWIPQGNQPNIHTPHDNSIPKNLQEMHHNQITLDLPLIHQNPNPSPSPYQLMNWGFSPNQNPIMKEATSPSLFSAQHQNQNQNCAAISATALLQRATQIGDSSNILGKFGRDEDGDKLCGLYNTTNSGTSGLGSDVELSVYPPTKRCRRAMMTSDEEIGLGETRDFLGMQRICNPSSINGWI